MQVSTLRVRGADRGGLQTMNPQFMESVWWVFKQLFDKEGCISRL